MRQKLELTWIGKTNWHRLEPRILLEDPAKSYHAEHWVKVERASCPFIPAQDAHSTLRTRR
ncbi:MAG: hypothetical protein IPL59_24115 [Candidatus Competibacteraceae bacterium]|uniref:Uncharacterized protein n=1 Tax=Candidatus Contendobacter odensis Run_B_J11 TaxID=1400861 RepID=A0A7U7GFZ4_9GAMM|nr:hypothetical protein [Candidatus Competibacteraceae bacterium]MBK8750173.1 hypothetical protein [Candidatus Competibacteraceae bacterium]CDH47432.1 hypothetical protein BN874_810003 [Candidatus Contendobacter odensis Run_B_J11]